MVTEIRYPEEIRADAIERCYRAYLIAAAAACRDRRMLQAAADHKTHANRCGAVPAVLRGRLSLMGKEVTR